jgi:hypothetical protein
MGRGRNAAPRIAERRPRMVSNRDEPIGRNGFALSLLAPSEPQFGSLLASLLGAQGVKRSPDRATDFTTSSPRVSEPPLITEGEPSSARPATSRARSPKAKKGGGLERQILPPHGLDGPGHRHQRATLSACVSLIDDVRLLRTVATLG